MITLLLVEDNERLRQALKTGLEATGAVKVVYSTASGEEALEYCLAHTTGEPPQAASDRSLVANDRSWVANDRSWVALLDVQLAGPLNGIQAAVAIRREFPRFPVVFYSIQDDDAFYRDFRRSGILSHYAYVRKSNYLMPAMIVPLIRDALSGRSFIDPEIEARVQEVRQKDEQSPMALLEPNEQIVARLLAQGLTNEQIASRLGFRDKRTISRTNGQIYLAWGLNESTTDEKIARTRAALIVQRGRLIAWDEEGTARTLDDHGNWIDYDCLDA